jgi:hypothetical protein
LIIALLCVAYYALYFAVAVNEWVLPILLFVSGALFLFFAKKDFDGEKIIAPLDV